MGLLRLMGNKADVVKGLAKRSNDENWYVHSWLYQRLLNNGCLIDSVTWVRGVAPRSDIGLYLSDIQVSY